MWEKEKLLVTSNFSFSHSVFNRPVLQTRENQGLFGKGLKPYKGKGLQSYGDGLYLKQGGKLYDGKGLLLGPNNPFANIPILGAIL